MSAGYDKQALDRFLSLLPDKIRGNVLPVTPVDVKQPYLLHMSKDTGIKSFAPRVSNRTLSAEDRSVPRICVAPTLAGAIMGYSSDLSDFQNQYGGSADYSKRRVPYKGGWWVYAIPFDVALRPTRKILPDVERTDEHWLVTFDPNTIEYKPIPIAKFFYRAVTMVATDRRPSTKVELMVEVLGDEPLRFDNKTVLTKGYWRLTVDGLHTARRWDRIPSVEVSEIPKVEYSATKQLVASMLSVEEATPVSAMW